MENVTIKDIVEATGGVLLCGDENKVIRGFSIDSREGSEDSIFYCPPLARSTLPTSPTSPSSPSSLPLLPPS